jgi:hypothetical protein
MALREALTGVRSVAKPEVSKAPTLAASRLTPNRPALKLGFAHECFFEIRELPHSTAATFGSRLSIQPDRIAVHPPE